MFLYTSSRPNRIQLARQVREEFRSGYSGDVDGLLAETYAAAVSFLAARFEGGR